MRTIALLSVMLAASAAHADELVKLFNDQGKTYLRSERAASLLPGAELPAFSDPAGTKTVGKAIVMEVVGQLVRVSFDEETGKAGAKYVRLTAPSTAREQPPPPLPALKATLGRDGPAITIRNDSDGELTGCELRFPDRRYAPAGTVPARMTVAVGYDKIKPAPDLGDEVVLVRCAEGEAELVYGQPAKSKALVGRAVAGRGGGVFIYNDGDRDWTQCDLVKPNGTHFFQGSLKARSSDSIRGGLFKPPTGPEIIVLTCAQGAVSQPVP